MALCFAGGALPPTAAVGPLLPLLLARPRAGCNGDSGGNNAAFGTGSRRVRKCGADDKRVGGAPAQSTRLPSARVVPREHAVAREGARPEAAARIRMPRRSERGECRDQTWTEVVSSNANS